MAAAVIYEVNLDYRGQASSAFDEWLDAHVEDMLALDGFIGATIARPTHGDSPDADGAIRRTVQYRLDSQASLDAYLQNHAPRMRAHGKLKFGDSLGATRRILIADTEKTRGMVRGDAPQCRNCGQLLTGQYCASCGQRDKHRMISLLELVRDFVGDLFELDSRIWRSLFPLLFRPGFLTLEYLSGRRVSFTPPLRMYLVVSLLLFVVVSTGNRIEFHGDETRDVDLDATVEVLKEAQLRADIINEIEAEIAAARERNAGAASEIDPADELEVDTGELEFDDDCNITRFPGELGWLDRPAVRERIESSCRRLKREGGLEQFIGDLMGNIPTMMFFFLPILAFVMKLLYAGSRRYYVEHLLFFVHFHSYFYLAAALTIGLARLPEVLPGQGVLNGLMIAALGIYSPYYLFRSMRVVYAQHWLFTVIKFLILNAAYFFGLLLTFGVTALITALMV